MCWLALRLSGIQLGPHMFPGAHKFVVCKNCWLQFVKINVLKMGWKIGNVVAVTITFDDVTDVKEVRHCNKKCVWVRL